jgi:hypothetical protein
VASDRLTAQINTHHGVEIDIDIDEEASDLLRCWLPFVRALPQLIGAEQHEAAVRELVAWYQHVSAASDYCGDPPIEGLDALVDELVHVSVPPDEHTELAKGRWAISVAEELASWRRYLRDDDEADLLPTRQATDRLELAIAGARRNIIQRRKAPLTSSRSAHAGPVAWSD